MSIADNWIEALPNSIPKKLDTVRFSKRIRLLDWIFNTIAWGCLVGIFAIGQHWDWKLPSVPSLLYGEPSLSVDWCNEHSIPSSICIECNPLLLPKPKPIGFCKIHGVAECVLDHPELAQLNGSATLPRYETFKAIGIKPRNENNSRDALIGKRVQFASNESIEKAGIDISVVSEQPMAEFIAANAELIFDPTRVARLSARIDGSVVHVFKQTGDSVQAGEILAIIDAAEVGRAKARLVQAVVQLQLRRSNAQRIESIVHDGAISQKTAIEAESALQEAQVDLLTAQQTLANLGFELPDDIKSKTAEELSKQLMTLGLSDESMPSPYRQSQSANLIPVRSPIQGTIVSADLVVGEVVQPGPIYFTVADTSKLWLMMNFRQEDANLIRLGARAIFCAETLRHEATGEVTWISPTIDDKTRTIAVRAAIDNSDSRFRNNTFGTSRILLREQPQAITVPKSAIQSTKNGTYVFVRDKDFFKPGAYLFFHVRQVRIGAQDDEQVELLAGALPGEVIATRGSTALLAQLLKSNLGAGCGCCEE